MVVGLHPEGSNCLVIGQGPGSIVRGYERRGILTDVVDIDPGVVEIAAGFFGFQSAGEIVVDDARHFLATTDHTYDFIVLDATSGDLTPGYLLIREAMALIAGRLEPEGVMALNLIGSTLTILRAPL